MKRLLTAALLACMAIAVAAAQQGTRPATTAAAQFEAARKKEVVDGDLAAAIALYRELAERSDRAVAAKALMRMGECYEKLGATQTAESRKAYERLVRDFADQKDVADQARARLAVLAPAAASIPPSPAGSIRRLYQGPGLPTGQGVVELSADARYAVFHQARGNEFIVRDLTTGKERHVPHPSPDALAAEWRGTSSDPVNGAIGGFKLSPDGTQIAYAVDLRAAVRPGEKPRQSQVRVVNTDGAGGRLVMKTDRLMSMLMRWTADGNSVLAVLESPGERASSFVSVRLSDGTVTPVSPSIPASDGDVGLSLSPDGRFVVVLELSLAGSGSRLHVVDTRNGKRTPITDLVKSDTWMSNGWVPDGSGVVFVSDQSGTLGLWLQPISEGVPQGPPQLLRDLDKGTESLGVGPDGSYYYTKGTQVATRYVAALNPATGKVSSKAEPVPDLQNTCGYDWSPDGSTIAYGAGLGKAAGEAKSPCTLVVLRSLADGRERVLSPGMSEIRRPRWSPDGRQLVVFGQKGGTFGIFRLDAETSSARLLVETPPNQSTGEMIPSPEWALDGKGLFFGRYGLASDGTLAPRTWTVVHRDLETGKETERYSRTGGRIWFTSTSVSREGALCLLVNEADGRAAVVVPPGGGPSRTVYRVPADRAFSSAVWSADGRSIYIPERVPDASVPNTRKLLRVPVDGGEPVDAGLTLAGLDFVQPSRDGKRLFFVTFENRVEIWAIDRLVPTKAGAPAAPKK